MDSGHDEDGYFLRSSTLPALFSFSGFTHQRWIMHQEEGSADYKDFSMIRLRTQVGGYLLHPSLEYKCSLEFADGMPSLRSAWIQWTHRIFSLRIGQSKHPFAFNALRSLRRQLFVDRTNATLSFRYLRGLQARLTTDIRKLQWTTAVTSGPGTQNKPFTDGNSVTFVNRLAYAFFGEHDYSIDLFGTSEQVALVTGIAHAYGKSASGKHTSDIIVRNDFGRFLPDYPDDYNAFNINSYTCDALLQYKQLMFESAVYVRRMSQTGTRVAGGFPRWTDHGLMSELSWMAWPEHMGMAVRYSQIDYHQLSNLYESGVGLVYYFKGNDVRVSADLRNIHFDNRNTVESRIQLQLCI
jgi:hypothetical protein